MGRLSTWSISRNKVNWRSWLGGRETKYRVEVREVERLMVRVRVSWWSDSCEV